MQPLQARLPLKDPRPLRPPGGIKVESRPNTHALDALDDEQAEVRAEALQLTVAAALADKSRVSVE